MAEGTIDNNELSLFRVATITSGIASVAADADWDYLTGSYLSYSGYTPVAIVGHGVLNGNYNNCNEFCDIQSVKMFQQDSNGIKCAAKVHNYKSSTISVKIQFKVLYVRAQT